MPKKRNRALAVSPYRTQADPALTHDEPLSVTKRRAIARNAAVDIVVRTAECTCSGVQGKHSDDCDFVQTRPMPKGQPVMIETVIHHVQPKHGDVLILAIKTSVPERQLRAFRRGLYSFSEDHFKETGVKIQFLVVNCDLDVHHLTREQREEMLHANKVVLDKDGSLIETLRAIDDEPPNSEGGSLP